MLLNSQQQLKVENMKLTVEISTQKLLRGEKKTAVQLLI